MRYLCTFQMLSEYALGEHLLDNFVALPDNVDKVRTTQVYGCCLARTSLTQTLLDAQGDQPYWRTGRHRLHPHSWALQADANHEAAVFAPKSVYARVLVTHYLNQ